MNDTDDIPFPQPRPFYRDDWNGPPVSPPDTFYWEKPKSASPVAVAAASQAPAGADDWISPTPSSSAPNKSGADDWVDDWTTPEAPRPEAIELGSGKYDKPIIEFGKGVVDTAGRIGTQLGDAALYHLPAAVAATWEGSDPYAERDWADALIERSRAKTKSRTAEGGTGPTVIPGLSKEDINSLGPSIAFSAPAMAGGVAAGLGAGAAGSALTTPVGGAVAGWTAGTAASGAIAYRQSANQFVRDLRDTVDQERTTHGLAPISDDDFRLKSDELAPLVREYGLWEAVPEAAGNALGLKILTAPVKSGIGRVFGQNIATRFATKAAALYGSELATETVTQQGQHNVEASAKENVTGAPQSRRDWTSPSDIGESFKEIAAPTILQTTLMGAGVKAGERAYAAARGQAAPTETAQQVANRIQPAAGQTTVTINGETARTANPAQNIPQNIPNYFDHLDILAVSPVEQRVLQSMGFTTEQIAAMPREQIDAELDKAADQSIPQENPNDRTDQPGLPGQGGIVGPEPVQAQSVQGAGTEAAQTGGVVQGAPGEAANPPGQDVTGQQLLQDILADPRSAAEIRAEADQTKAAREAAAAFQPTNDWQDAPQFYEPGDGIDIKVNNQGRMQVRLAPEAGTREAPVNIAAPEDVHAGAELTAEPTPAQSEAGNYQKRHVRWNGLDIAIETEAGQERRGVGPDGKPWSAKMPVPYGYIKRTEGKDGDQVDVYLGPQPKASTVFVVDQIDPQSGKFDEHKIMLGFPDVASASAAYGRAFSDGSAADRAGHVTEMSVDEFKTWLASGNTKKALTYKREPIKNIKSGPRQATGPFTLRQFLASRGGLRPDPGGELKSLGLTGKSRIVVPGLGYRNLIHAKGMTLDQAREAAVEAGYIQDAGFRGAEQATSTPNELLDMLAAEEGGRDNYRQGEELTGTERGAESQRDADEHRLASVISELQDFVKAQGLLATDEQIREAAEASLTQGIAPDDAIDRVVERDVLAEQREAEEYIGYGEPVSQPQTAAATGTGGPSGGNQVGPPVGQHAQAAQRDENESAQGREPTPEHQPAPRPEAVTPESEPKPKLTPQQQRQQKAAERKADQAAAPAVVEPGFTPSQMKELLDAEQEQIINMWHEAKRPLPPNASDHSISVRKRMEKNLDQLGVWQARTEDEVRDILFEKRGERVKATKPETVEATAEPGADNRPQLVIPGAERDQAGAAQNAADKPLKPTKAQKPADEGLFGDGHKQGDLLDQKPKPAAGWTEIGKNADGRTLYEDQRGVRSYVENGVRVTEAVRIIPTRQGVQIELKPHEGEWKTVEEQGATQPESSKPEPAPAEQPNDFNSLLSDVLDEEFGKKEPTAEDQGFTIGGFYDTKKQTPQEKRKAKAQASKPPTDLASLQAQLPPGYTAKDIGGFANFRVEGPNGFGVETNDATTALKEARKHSRPNRTKTQLAGSTAQNVVKGADDAFAGLVQLFGGGKTVGHGLNFDEDTWAKAKPLFKQAAESFGQAFADARELLQRIVKELRSRNGFSREVFERMSPYLQRFVQEVQSGEIVLYSEQGGTNAQPGTDGQRPSEQAGGLGQGGISKTRPGGKPPRNQGSENLGGEQAPVAGGDQESGSGNGPGARPDGANAGVGGEVSGGGTTSAGRPRAGGKGVATPGTGGRPEHASLRPNYHLTEPERLVGGGPKARFGRNKAAISAYRSIVAEGRDPTPEELDSMAAYIGWGSFGQELFQGTWERPHPKEGWEDEDKWLREELGADEWKSAQASIINAHYTDPPTVTAMWDMARAMGFPGGRVLEPSMGIGNFFGLMPRDLMGESQLTGIELDKLTGGMANLLYPHANVQIKGYQDSKTADNFYDLVVGNWPFAAQAPADRRYSKLHASLHDFFFVKALDQVRPGGIVMGITSSGTMDKIGKPVRIHLAKNAELVAAFRLPSGAFKQYAGTSVVTDIIILRKRDKPILDVTKEGWIESNDKEMPGGKIRINEYWNAHPDHILGELGFGHGTTQGREGMIVTRQDDFPARLEGLSKRVPADGFQAITRGNEPRFEQNNTSERELSVIAKDGQFYQVQGDRLAALEDVVKGFKSDSKAGKQIPALLDMRRGYDALLRAERDGAENTETLRASLKKTYDTFRAKHGRIVFAEGMSALKKAEDPHTAVLIALETPDGTPARILSESTTRSKRRLEEPTVRDAFVLQRNQSTILDMDAIAEGVGKSVEDVANELLASKAVYRTPGGGFEVADVYLSGNVRRKLREALEAKQAGEDMDGSIEALKEVIPPDIPYHKIEAKLGATWVTNEDYKKFIAEMLGVTDTSRIEVEFAAGRWKVHFDDRNLIDRPEAQATWGHIRYPFDKLVQAGMGNVSVTIREYDPVERRDVVNPQATKEVNERITKVREHFQDWAWKDLDRRVALERSYNDTMRSIAAPKYDGSFLEFVGMSLQRGKDAFSLRKHQVDAIWRGIVNRSGLYAHEVGTGKTYTMGGIAVESRRYGIARKPLIMAHNANSASVAREIQEMYPGAKVLYVDNLTPQTIDVTMRRIANDDWDAVVVPHSLIDRFALSEETLNSMMAEEIAALEQEAIAAANQDGANLTVSDMDNEDDMKKVRSPTAKQLVKQRNQIIEKIKAMAQRASRENAVKFEDLGVDMILVDEVHEFKKPPITTRMKMRGLNTGVSGRSISLRFLTDYVKSINGGRGVHVFTGTPITNTLNEIYNMQRFVMDDVMSVDGIKDWDAWFNTFADADTDVELTDAGDYEAVTRLASFVNVADLRLMLGQYMDIVFADDMPEFKPREVNGKTLKSADLTDAERKVLSEGRTENPMGRPYKKIINDIGPMSPEQERVLRHLAELAQDFRGDTPKGRRERMLSGHPSSPIIVGTNAAKAGLDVRLYDKEAPDHPKNKASRVSKNVLDLYKSDKRTTQVIFVDTGYSDTATRSAGKDANGNKLTQRVGVFNLVQDVVDRLVKGGIPRDQIAIVSGSVSKPKRAEIARKMNSTEIRVVIGLSDTLGVGVNMQENLRAMHHMDAPWTPGELEQRNGRGERQGNKWNTVLEYRYITEKLDGRRWQVLAIKDRFIKSFLKADASVRVIDGDAVSTDESENVSTLMETLSAASGDPRVLLRQKYIAKINKLENRERLHTYGIHDAKEQAKHLRGEIASMEVAVKQARQDQAAFEEASKDGAFTATIDGKEYTKRKEAEDAILPMVRDLKKGESKVIATVQGFDLAAQWRFSEPEYYLDTRAGRWTARPSIASAEGILRNVKKRADETEQEIADKRKSIERMDAAQKEPFAQSAQLDEARRSLEEIDADMARSPAVAPSWLRQGAPVDTEIYLRHDDALHKRVVTGHRWGDTNYFVVTATGDVAYLNALDQNGQRLYEPHPFEAPVKQKPTAQGQPSPEVPRGWDAIDAAPRDTTKPRRPSSVTETVSKTKDGSATTYGAPAPFLLEYEQKVANAVAREADRILPGVNVRRYHKMWMETPYKHGTIHGLFHKGGLGHVIAWSLESPNAPHTIRHEALHYLRHSGLISEKEWAALEDAAKKEGWIEKHGIDTRYGNFPEAMHLEEAIAEEFAGWREEKAQNLPGRLWNVFERIDLFLRRIAAAVRRIAGRPITASDVLTRIETGEVGRRAGKRTAETEPRPQLAPKDEWALFQNRKRNAEKLRAAEEESEKATEKPEGTDHPRAQIPRSPAEKKVLERVAPSDEKASRKITFNSLYTDIKDDLNPIRVLRNELAENKALPAAKDPYVLARLTRGSYGKAQQFLEHGTFDFNTLQNTGKSLKDILKPVRNDLDGLRAYAMSKRTLELTGRGIKTGVPLKEAQDTVTAGAAKYEATFQELQTYQRALTGYLHAAGIISDQGYAAMLAANKDYVPFFRLMGDTELGSGLGPGLKVKDPIRGIRGSDRKIIDPIMSIIKNTYLFVALAEHNRAMTALADLADASPRGVDLMPKTRPNVHPIHVTEQEIGRFLTAQGVDPQAAGSMTIFRPNPFRPGPNEIALFRNGKRETRTVDTEVAEAVNALDRETHGLLVRLLAIPARTLRAGAVLAPEFIARNPVRDQFEATLLSEHGYIPIWDLARGMGALFKRSDHYQRWLKSGGANAALVGIDRNYINQNILKLEKPGALDRLKNVVRSPLEFLRMLSEFSENATRLGEFIRATGKGKDPFTAGYASREVTIDFARMGTQTRALNMIVPFWNAQVEGNDRLVRGFAKAPGRTLLKATLIITLPSVLLWWANHDDDRWKELPAWQRDLFWIILTDKWEPHRIKDGDKWRDATDDDVGDMSKRTDMRKVNGKWQINNGTIWRIPKPFAPGVLFGSIPERLLDAYADASPKAFKNLGKTVASAVFPNFIPQALQPLIEQWANRSLFLDRPIVPKYLEEVRPKYQSTGYTTESAKLIGAAIAKINDKTSFGSPMVLENYVRSWTGNLGMSALALVDKGLTMTGAVPEKVEPTKTWADMPLIRAFAVRYPSAGAQSVQDFYDEYGERKVALTTMKYLAKGGNAEGAEAERTEHAVVTAEKIHRALGVQSKLIRGIYADKELTADDKRTLIDQTYLQMIELAKIGNQIFDATAKKK